jgi:hypothetical protein
VDRKWLSPPLTAANEMAELWREVGLQHVEQTSLLIRMEYSSLTIILRSPEAKVRWDN